MKNKFYCIVLIACTLSCEHVPDFHVEIGSDSSMPTLRSIADAERIAIEALQTFPPRTLTKSQTRIVSDINLIKSVDTKSSNQEVLMYAVNFNDSNGFALVAANPDKPALLALSYNGSYDGSETDCAAFNFYMDGLKDALVYDANISRGGIVGDFYYTDFDTTYFSRAVNPEIDCNWHQGAPFDTYCLDAQDNLCPAGCGAVAVAHALSRYSVPDNIPLTFTDAPQSTLSINWDNCKNHNYAHGTCSTCTSNALLMREIGERCHMSYSTAGSSSYLGDLQECLTSFGYQSEFHSGYDFSKILNSLNTNKTVILRGARQTASGYVGHFWNVDGYIYNEETVKCYTATNNNPLKQYEGFETTKTWHLYFEFGWQTSMYDGYYIAYSSRYGDGLGFYDSIVEEPMLTMFQCPSSINYANGIYMLTNIFPAN